MYSYTYDTETGGILLQNTPLEFSKEPRPVYYKELDILGFDKVWNYAKDDTYPYMWAEANNYYYRGRLVAKTKGGSLYTAPEIEVLDEPEANGAPLRFVDVPAMVEKNSDLIDQLTRITIKKVFNTYKQYQNKVDVFYVAFSGGKDSVVALDIVQKALPHNAFKVLFGDTGMEFPDTYDVVEKIKKYCDDEKIEFYTSKSRLSTEQSWQLFGPPAVTIRWCCSVRKTAPQVLLLQSLSGKSGFTGMAFTGIRRDESVSRSEYDDVSLGNKHRGQYSCHAIIDWNSAELFLYILHGNLILNEAYKKGTARVGCLVCPMSSGKHEFIKSTCYPNEVTGLVDRIKQTSSKTGFTDEEMTCFIEAGYWKTRKSGRELNFGFDKHTVEVHNGKTSILLTNRNERWKEWAKTIGTFSQIDEDNYTILFKDKLYDIKFEKTSQGDKISFPNCGSEKDDTYFLSLFKSVIVKSIYCVECGACEANCSTKSITMMNGIKITDSCVHCYQCHDMFAHCLRYNSIRNVVGGEKMSKGLDRYYSFGIRKRWMDIFFREKGKVSFWDENGDGIVANKKKDAFLNFVKDAGLVVYNKSSNGDKYSKNEPSDFACTLFTIGTDSENTWALMLCNLAYTPTFNWFVKNIIPNETVTLDKMKYMLNDVMEGDTKGIGKRNITDAFKAILIKTPLGTDIGLGVCDYTEKTNSAGAEILTLNSFVRTAWQSPDPRVILYSLYKFAEACGGYYQFTLTRLLDHSVDSDGVSPTQIFGLDRDTMTKLLNGLTVNYPEFINASFTHNLDNITLSADKTSQDVLNMF